MSELRANNHYTPRSYLENFSCSPGLIVRYRIIVSHHSVKPFSQEALSRTGSQEHLYTVAFEEGPSDEIERWLADEFDTPAHPCIQRAVEHRPMTAYDWGKLALFYGVQTLRTPAAYLKRAERWEKSLPPVMENLQKNLLRFLPKARGQDLTGEFYPSDELRKLPIRFSVEDSDTPGKKLLKTELTAGRKLWMYELEQVLRADGPRELLRKHRWTLLRPAEGNNWFTSDHPAVCLVREWDRSMSFGYGWDKKENVLFLPLSPEVLLYTEVGLRKPPKPYTRLSQEKTIEIQRIIANHAFRNIYSAAEDPLIERLRPRLVDKEQFEYERDQFRNWHEDHTKAELFMDESKWQPGSSLKPRWVERL